jgi:hypothetical protein
MAEAPKVVSMEERIKAKLEEKGIKIDNFGKNIKIEENEL